MNEVATIMDNPVNKRYLRKWIIISLLTFTIGLAYMLFRIEQWNAVSTTIVLIVLIFAFLFPFFLGWDKEYLRRPFKVEIRDDGILCHFRFNRKVRFFPWDQFISLTVTPGGPSDPSRYHDLDDIMWIKNEMKRDKREFFILHWSIAVAVRDKYRERTGRYPPMNFWEQASADISASAV
jgi:hypothetical protein